MNTPVRILHLRASNYLGGPDRQLLRYASYERRGPIEIIIATFVDQSEGKAFADAARQQDTKVLALPTGNFGKTLSKLVRFIRDEAIGLVCTHGYKADIFGTFAARIARIPVAAFLRGWTGEDYKVRLYEWVDRAVVRRANRIICLSETQAHQLSGKRNLADRLRIVLNVVEERNVSHGERLKARKELQERLALPSEGPIVASAGRLSPEKGVINFVEVLPAIHSGCPEAQFIIFGEGPLKSELQTKSHKLGLDGVLHFAGHAPDFLELLPGIDLIVNPSLSEVMPNVILESMAAGVPVVATEVGGVREIAGEEGAVYVVPPEDPAQLAEAVLGLFREPTSLMRLGEVGQNRVRKAFCPAEQKRQLRSLYQELIPSFTGVQNDGAALPGDAALSAKSNHAEGSQASPTFISVVVPVRNEEVHLRELLRDLLAQDYPADCYEIIVADGNSTDRTRKIVEEWAARARPRIRCVHNPKELSSAGRNLGVLNSHGDVVLFIDGHCRVPNTNLFRSVVTAFERTGADCLCRPQPLNMAGNTWFQDIVAHTRASFVGHGLDSTIYSSNFEGYVDPNSSGAIYKRSVFKRVGLYDEKFDACEDVEFNHRVRRAGLSSYLSSRLAIQYRPRSNLCSLFKQLFRYGRGRFRLIRKHRDALSYSQLVPAGFVLWLLLAGLLSVASRYAAIALAVTVGAYMGVLLLAGAGLALRRGVLHFFVAPAVYATIHIGLGCGFWTEMCRSTRDLFSKSGGQSQAVGTAKAEVSQLSRESGSQC